MHTVWYLPPQLSHAIQSIPSVQVSSSSSPSRAMAHWPNPIIKQCSKETWRGTDFEIDGPWIGVALATKLMQ